MIFSKCYKEVTNSNVYLNIEELDIVTELKYLGGNSQSQFDIPEACKNLSKSINFHLQNFRHIRNSLTENAARMFWTR